MKVKLFLVLVFILVALSSWGALDIFDKVADNHRPSYYVEGGVK